MTSIIEHAREILALHEEVQSLRKENRELRLQLQRLQTNDLAGLANAVKTLLTRYEEQPP